MSVNPSLSSSVSTTSGIPSESVSVGVSLASLGSVPACVSYTSLIPSLSSSRSALSPTPSLSVSRVSFGSSGNASEAS